MPSIPLSEIVQDSPGKSKIVCPCGKVCFDKKGATTSMNWLVRKGKEKRLRIYPCPESNTWHMSHNFDREDNTRFRKDW